MWSDLMGTFPTLSVTQCWNYFNCIQIMHLFLIIMKLNAKLIEDVNVIDVDLRAHNINV